MTAREGTQKKRNIQKYRTEGPPGGGPGVLIIMCTNKIGRGVEHEPGPDLVEEPPPRLLLLLDTAVSCLVST